MNQIWNSISSQQTSKTIGRGVTQEDVGNILQYFKNNIFIILTTKL